MKIIKASLADLTIVLNIARDTFFETFREHNSDSDMDQYADLNLTEEKIESELLNINSEFYLAVEEDEVLGYLKVNSGSEQTELQDRHALEIERIYVKKEYHGKRVGQELYVKALEVARLKGLSYIWLGVWEQNQRAIRFYEKNGFIAFDRHIFKLGSDEQVDVMMKKQLLFD